MFYITTHPIRVGLLLYADDNLTPLVLSSIIEFRLFKSTYDQYKRVSGLNVNINKSMAICINTSEQLIDQLNEEGIQTPNNIRYLGIQLEKTIRDTAEITMRSIDPKMNKRRIMATTPPTDMVHRALLVNVALLPIYNHVFMSIPTPDNITENLEKEILMVLWTMQQDGITVKKRRLVSKQRVFSAIEMGGLQVNPPKMIIDGLRQNLLQKIYNKIRLNRATTVTELLEAELRKAKRPTLTEHVKKLGPKEWHATAQKLKTSHKMFLLSFESMAELLQLIEQEKETWCHSAIVGHSKTSLLFPFTRMESSFFLEQYY